MNLDSEAAGKKLLQFNVFTTAYKTVNECAITLDILVPKEIRQGKRPLLVRFHGGGLITGSSLFLGFFAPWIMGYALQHCAVIISPNYRLLPESTGLDLLDDLSDLWKWVHNDLQSFVLNSIEGELEVDTSRILVQGESAGGYLAIQSAIRQPSQTIKAVIAAYPMLDLQSRWFTGSFPKPAFDLPTYPSSVVDDHLATMKPNSIVSAVDPPFRVDLMFATLQNGRFLEMLGTHESLFPMNMINVAKAFPPLFIYHGRQDAAVPSEGTEKFVEKLNYVLPGAKVLLKIEDGNHGFDSGVEVETPWMKEGLNFMTHEWLGL